MTLRAASPDHPLFSLLFEYDGKQIRMADVEHFTAADILKLPDIATARKLAAAKFERNYRGPTESAVFHFAHLLALDDRARVVLVSFGTTGMRHIRWSFGRFSDPRQMLHLESFTNRNGTACEREGPVTTYPTGSLRITCPNCLLGLAAAHDTTPDKLYEEDATL